MDLDRSPAEIAHEIAKQTRALNHRTLDPAVFGQPGDVSEVVGALRTVVERLPQALQQAAAGLRRHDGAGGIRMDDGADPAVAAGTVLAAIEDAQGALWTVQEALVEASGPLSHMSGRVTADEGDGVEV
ncbi:hypothetical protein ACFV27_37100 [Streptomyces antimycoticus]|uniref:hypothetical protein n=1 Tax=Streptomyces antimycoticus TaxID=68175 RepID=UPI0036A6C400